MRGPQPRGKQGQSGNPPESKIGCNSLETTPAGSRKTATTHPPLRQKNYPKRVCPRAVLNSTENVNNPLGKSSVNSPDHSSQDDYRNRSMQQHSAKVLNHFAVNKTQTWRFDKEPEILRAFTIRK
jgi:hypothetical protein